MRPGMECLLQILRGQRVERAIDECEWAAALALAEEEHVLPWAAAQIRLQRLALPPAIAAKLDAIERDAEIQGFFWCAELKGVLREFERREIGVVPLKGPFLAERLYGRASLRMCRDLDLLVARADLAKAESALAQAGFSPGDADDYHRPWRRGSTTVELHSDVENPLAFDFHTEGALSRAQAGMFQGVCCQRLAPEDELLFLCLHAVRHRFERLSLIVDLQLAFEVLPAAVNGWAPRPEVAALDGLLVLGMAMVRRFQPDVPIGGAVLAGVNEEARLERLADLLWSQLLKETPERLDWRAAHAFFVEIERPGWPRLRRRMRHARILLGRVIAPDYTFAARFGLRRRWQAQMLRPLRLLCDAVRTASH